MKSTTDNPDDLAVVHAALAALGEAEPHPKGLMVRFVDARARERAVLFRATADDWGSYVSMGFAGSTAAEKEQHAIDWVVRVLLGTDPDIKQLLVHPHYTLVESPYIH